MTCVMQPYCDTIAMIKEMVNVDVIQRSAWCLGAGIGMDGVFR